MAIFHHIPKPSKFNPYSIFFSSQMAYSPCRVNFVVVILFILFILFIRFILFVALCRFIVHICFELASFEFVSVLFPSKFATRRVS